MDPKVLNKFFQKYAKQYMGSMYSSPLPDELAKLEAEGNLVCFEDPGFGDLKSAHTMVRTTKQLRRKSFTGTPYTIPAGTVIAEHVARSAVGGGHFLASPVQVAYIYQDDQVLREGVVQDGFELRAVKIAATSEVLGVYARRTPGSDFEPSSIPRSHELEDEPTLVELPSAGIDDTRRSAILSEVSGIHAYRDDYPYYNKNNSWQAASLRGYKPQDPLYGLKPSEMSRKWRLEHPEDCDLNTCHDTVLAQKCPTIMEFLSKLPFGSGFDRVRLLRLTEGELTRHCDITDRELGTRDGQICRLHMPLVTNPEVRSMVWGLDGEMRSVNLKPWSLYYMDIRKPHAAKNPTQKERIHLQIDVITDQRMRDVICAASPV